MAEQRLARFETRAQNINKMSVRLQAHLPKEKRTLTSAREGAFIQDMERIVCEEVNEKPWLSETSIRNGGRQAYVRPRSLHNRCNAKPAPLARQFCYYLLYDHPYLRRAFSSLRIAELYNRDHTTVVYGVHKVRERIKSQPTGLEAETLKQIVKRMAPHYGVFALPERVR